MLNILSREAELIDSEEAKQELQNVFEHITLLEEVIAIEKG